jgi:WXG100 family type VII secretion target
MATPRVRADYEILAQITQAFRVHASDCRKSLQRITQQMDTLQGGDWVGKGANAFYQEMNSSVLPSFNRLIASLEQASQDTRKMSDIMKKAEEEAASFFRLDVAGEPVAIGAAAPSPAAGGTSAGGGSAAAAALTAQAKISRDQAKKMAAAGSVALNYTAAALAGASVLSFAAGLATSVTGVGGLAGGGAGLVFGGLSAAAWWGGTHYQQLANDPPRDDFQTETKFQVEQFDFNPPADESEATWQELTRLLAAQSMAVKALVTSLERYDGVQAAAKTPDIVGAAAAELRHHELTQAEAIAHNASACAQIADALLTLQPDIDRDWRRIKEILIASGALETQMSPAELKSRYAEARKSSLESLRGTLKLPETEFAEMRRAMERGSKSLQLPRELPDSLLNDRWRQTMQDASARFTELSDSFTRVKAAMQAA